MSLVRSEAFPAQGDLDKDFIEFLKNDSTIYESLFASDREGALILHESMSGYATVRNFYDLRDRSSRGTKERNQAWEALSAIIASASDNVDGGMLDEKTDALIRYEGLLVLLGEALVFYQGEKFKHSVLVATCVDDFQMLVSRPMFASLYQ